jgi:hypothetical protein
VGSQGDTVLTGLRQASNQNLHCKRRSSTVIDIFRDTLQTAMYQTASKRRDQGERKRERKSPNQASLR